MNNDMTTLRISPEMRTLAGKVLQFDARETKVVILGGGTGLSTVVGGNAQRLDWARMPFVELLTLPNRQRKTIPRTLATSLRALGAYVTARGKGPTIDPSGHCLGNLLLTSAIFQAAHGRVDRPPSMLDIHKGLDAVGRLIGVTPSSLFPATATPGELQFRYANGVEVFGQSKSASARRNFPVERLSAEFNGKPVVSKTVRRSLREADLIILAPGSLYTSIIPVLQLKPIAEAIRANRKALKVLGANFWIQESETDISNRKEGKEFCVSELIEAYDRNVPGGARGLFQLVLSANLEHMPGNILRNYALEGKRPIHLDRARVTAMGVQPVEATLFSPD